MSRHIRNFNLDDDLLLNCYFQRCVNCWLNVVKSVLMCIQVSVRLSASVIMIWLMSILCQEFFILFYWTYIKAAILKAKLTWWLICFDPFGFAAREMFKICCFLNGWSRLNQIKIIPKHLVGPTKIVYSFTNTEENVMR